MKTANTSNATADDAHLQPGRSRSGRRWRNAALGLGIALVVGVWLFREPLRRRIFNRAVLANDAPTDEAVQQMIQNAADPHAAILAMWNTGKIVHRQLAIRNLSTVAGRDQPLPAVLRQMLLAAALDPDSDVREVALGVLDRRDDPDLPALDTAQVDDLDPQVRLLGLAHLKRLPAGVGVPLAAQSLNDTDPGIQAYAVKLMGNWSGQDFGVKLSDAVPIEDAKTGLTVFNEESYLKTRAGADRAAKWWAEHKADFRPIRLEIPSDAASALNPVYAGDFTLPALDGKSVRLSDFRGKTVLINFWATWCTACVSELPELIALQKTHNDHLVILGISLDSMPDEDKHEAPSSPNEIRQKIARTVASRGINYPVLLDLKDEVGARFNGGELPTTVIVDSQGRIRRRFIGARGLPVFEAMIAEAGKPMAQIRPPHASGEALKSN